MNDALDLIDIAGVRRMTGGWHVSIRAELVDATPQRPKGVDYGLVLNNPNGERVLGFDNSHAYDGADSNEPFDHEHRRGKPGRTFRYDYTTSWALLSDFWDRIDEYIEFHQERTGETLEFLDEGEMG